MKFFIVLSALVAVAVAKPGQLLLNPALSYAVPNVHVKLVPGAPTGYDGRVVDTPEVVQAKAEHNAAHLNEKITLANEAVKSADVVTYVAAPSVIATSYQPHAYHGVLPVQHAVAPLVYTKVVPAAPLGHDGRVVDTPEVAHAKAAHAAAHINEKANLALEEAKSSHYAVPHVQLAVHSAPLVSVW